jgi:hypothetical protein
VRYMPRVALAMAASVTLGACGEIGANGSRTEPVQLPQVLRAEQVDRHPRASPARAFFEWWQALQFDNPVAASSHYSKSLQITPARLTRLLSHGTIYNLSSIPRLDGVLRKGNRATVSVFLITATKNPNGRVERVGKPFGFNLVREDGEWKLSDNLYLVRRARLAVALKRAAEEIERKRRAERRRPG